MAFGRVLAVPFVAIAVALGACGGSAAQPAGPATTVPARAPQVLTARHHLRTFRLARGRAVAYLTASLVLGLGAAAGAWLATRGIR